MKYDKTHGNNNKTVATVATRTQDQTLPCVLKTVATMATRTQDQPLLWVLKTAATQRRRRPRIRPPVCSEDGGNSDDTGHGHSVLLTSTSKPTSFFRSLSPTPQSPPCAHSSCRTRGGEAKCQNTKRTQPATLYYLSFLKSTRRIDGFLGSSQVQ